MRHTSKNIVRDESNNRIENASISSSGRSKVYHVEWSDQLIVHIKVRQVTGNNPTMGVKVQCSPDQVQWDDLGSVSFNSDGQNIIRETNFGKYIRLVWTLGGTNPVFANTDIIIQNKGE